jgi:uncharacterized membrane protein
MVKRIIPPKQPGRLDVFLEGPRIRLVIAVILGLAVFILTPHRHALILRALAAWDTAVLVFIVLILTMMAHGTQDHMRRRAAAQDQGRWIIFTVILVGSLFSLLALGGVQKLFKAAEGDESVVYLLTIIGTILLAWLQVHTVFALRYAHAYYGLTDDEDDEDGLIGGLEFPSEKAPDYWDFMYFSFVIGMTCQVSDVQVSGRNMRRLALVHGIVSFLFNTIILALTINIVASAI